MTATILALIFTPQGKSFFHHFARPTPAQKMAAAIKAAEERDLQLTALGLKIDRHQFLANY